MRLPQRIPTIAAAALFAVASAGTVWASDYRPAGVNVAVPALRGYTGNWPATVSKSQFYNGTYCLTLDGGSSGSASLVAGNQKYPYGSFLVMNGILIVTIQQPLGSQNGALLFIAPADDGRLAQGDFEDVAGGESFDSGDVEFGRKGRC